MTIRAILAGMAAAAAMSGMAVAQDSISTLPQPAAKAPAQPQGQPTPEEMEAAWMATMEPAAEHEKLAPMVGKWETTGRFWMEPGAEPVEMRLFLRNGERTLSETWAYQYHPFT